MILSRLNLPPAQLLPRLSRPHILTVRRRECHSHANVTHTFLRARYMAHMIALARPQRAPEPVREDIVDVFETCLARVTPQMGIKLKPVWDRGRGSGKKPSIYHIPVPLTHEQANKHATDFVVKASIARKGGDLRWCMKNEFLDILNGQAKSLLDKNNMHKDALKNRHLASYRW
eukprot:606203_1